MPQKFQTERRYVKRSETTLLQPRPAPVRQIEVRTREDNLLILWADEAQRFMTASEDGTSDYNCVDVIREAGATIVAAAQARLRSCHRSATTIKGPDSQSSQ